MRIGIILLLLFFLACPIALFIALIGLDILYVVSLYQGDTEFSFGTFFILLLLHIYNLAMLGFKYGKEDSNDAKKSSK